MNPKSLIAVALSCLGLLTAGAAQAADSLARIKDSATVTLGVREASGVLSYALGDGRNAGYHVELCERVMADVQAQLGLARLALHYVPVSSQNRIEMLHNGSIDIECGSTTNNALRQRDVSFAVTTFVEEVRIAVKTDSGITGIAQLAGRAVATTTGSTSVQLLRRHQRARGIEFRAVCGTDHDDSFVLLQTGRADAFVMDAQILAGAIARAAVPADYRIVGEVLSREPIAIMLRKDDAAFKKAVDASLVAMMKSGEIARLFDKWFMQPSPPDGVRLGLVASESL